MSATIREIVDAALTVVGEVAGPGVQVYEEDRMMDDAVRAFNMMFKKYDWHQYLDWFDVTLNGTLATANGKAAKSVESPFEQVKDFEDFVAVHQNGFSERLPIAPTRMNPSVLGTGSLVRYWTSMNATDPDYVKKKLIYYPVGATGKLNVLAKVYPLKPPAIQFDWQDKFFLDKDMLAYATAFMTLSGDDLNAAAADVVRNLMEMKYRDVTAALAKHPIPVRSTGSIPSTWQVV